MLIPSTLKKITIMLLTKSDQSKIILTPFLTNSKLLKWIILHRDAFFQLKERENLERNKECLMHIPSLINTSLKYKKIIMQMNINYKKLIFKLRQNNKFNLQKLNKFIRMKTILTLRSNNSLLGNHWAQRDSIIHQENVILFLRPWNFKQESKVLRGVIINNRTKSNLYKIV